MTNTKKFDAELDRLMSFLADSVGEMSDAQIEEEWPREEEPRAKTIFRNALKDLRHQKLREARKSYESASKEISTRSYDLPQTTLEQRRLLALILNRHPDIKSLALTAHHRHLEELTDFDVASFLKQLAALGFLESFERGE